MSKDRCLHCELHDTLAKFVADVGPSSEAVLEAVANLAAKVILTIANGDQAMRQTGTDDFAKRLEKTAREIAVRQYRESRAGRA